MPKEIDQFFSDAHKVAEGLELEEKPPVEQPTDEEKAAAETERLRLEKEKSKRRAPQDSVDTLRKQRDDFEKKVQALEAEKARISEELQGLQKYKSLSTVAEYLEKKEGKIDEEVVDKFIGRNAERKKKLTESETKLKEKDETLRNVSIELSDDWIEDYKKPLTESYNNLTAIVAEVHEGKVKHPELIQSLRGQLLATNQDGSPLNSIQIKSVLSKFAKDYRDKTGEEYMVPMLNQVVDSISTVHTRFNKSQKARSNWEESQKQKQKESLYVEGEARKELIRKELAGRDFLYEKAKKSFDVKKLEGVLTEDEIHEMMDATHQKFSEAAMGKGKLPEYEEVITISAKAGSYDKLIEKIRTLETQLADEIKKRNSGLPRRGVDRQPRESSGDPPETKSRSVGEFFAEAESKL